MRIEARPERLSADAGALLLRELMERLGYTALFRTHLSDPRDPARVTHSQAELLRTVLLLLAQGWSDHTDVTWVREDPVLRLAVSCRRGQRPLRTGAAREPEGLCSQPTLSRLLAVLGSEENRQVLGSVLLDAAERRMRLRAGRRVAEMTLDLDSVPVEVFGRRIGSAYNGHYGQRCFHPLVVRSARGDYLGARLRPGNAYTAEGAATSCCRSWSAHNAGPSGCGCGWMRGFRVRICCTRSSGSESSTWHG